MPKAIAELTVTRWRRNKTRKLERRFVFYDKQEIAAAAQALIALLEEGTSGYATEIRCDNELELRSHRLGKRVR